MSGRTRREWSWPSGRTSTNRCAAGRRQHQRRDRVGRRGASARLLEPDGPRSRGRRSAGASAPRPAPSSAWGRSGDTRGAIQGHRLGPVVRPAGLRRGHRGRCRDGHLRLGHHRSHCRDVPDGNHQSGWRDKRRVRAPRSPRIPLWAARSTTSIHQGTQTLTVTQNDITRHSTCQSGSLRRHPPAHGAASAPTALITCPGWRVHSDRTSTCQIRDGARNDSRLRAVAGLLRGQCRGDRGAGVALPDFG